MFSERVTKIVDNTEEVVLYLSRDELKELLELLSIPMNNLLIDSPDTERSYQKVLNIMEGKTLSGALAGRMEDLRVRIDGLFQRLKGIPKLREKVEQEARVEALSREGIDPAELEVANDALAEVKTRLERISRSPPTETDEYLRLNDAYKLFRVKAKEAKTTFTTANKAARNRNYTKEQMKEFRRVADAAADEMDEFEAKAEGYEKQMLEYMRNFDAERKKYVARARELEGLIEASAAATGSVEESIKRRVEIFEDEVTDALTVDFEYIVIDLCELMRLKPGIAERIIKISRFCRESGEDFVQLVMEYLDVEYPPVSRLNRDTQIACREMTADDKRANSLRGLSALPNPDEAKDPEERERLDKMLQSKTSEILSTAVSAVKEFNTGIFEVTTNLDFTALVPVKKPDGTVTIVSRQTLPRQGYFEFDVTSDYVQKYDEYQRKIHPISSGDRERMIESLSAVKRILEKHSNNITYINRLGHVAVTNSVTFYYDRSVRRSIFMELIDVTIEQLRGEYPDLDNYSRSFYENATGSEPMSASDQVLSHFINPFKFSPVYLLYGVAGIEHSAINKIHYWLHIVNSACKDLDCIPCALSVIQPGIVKVPSKEIAEVRKIILGMTAEELSSHVLTFSIYQKLLAPLTSPWIVVTNVTETGNWNIISCSNEVYGQMSPLTWLGNKNKIIGLHVRNNHMTRIVDLENYSEVGWKYTKEGFAVLASVSEHSGFGRPLMKLLKGHCRLRQAGNCCIGDEAFNYLLEISFACTGARCLGHLSHETIIPYLVKDAIADLERLFNEDTNETIRAGPGVFHGKTYLKGVPVRLLNIEECTSLALDEWKRRKAVTNPQELIDHDETYFNMWSILRLPRWLIVSNIQSNPPAWTVVAGSDPLVETLTPHEAVHCMDNVIVFVHNGRSDRGLKRVIDYLIDIPGENGLIDSYSMRYCFAVCCSNNGVVDSIRSYMPVDVTDGTPLIDEEELTEASEVLNDNGNMNSFISCFRRMRCVVISSLDIARGGRVKRFNIVAKKKTKVEKKELINGDIIEVGGDVRPEDIYDGALDLLRFFQDPDGKLWLIVGRQFYNMNKILKELIDELPICIMAVDLETLNWICNTRPVLAACALYDGVKITPCSFAGTECCRQVIRYAEEIVINRRCKLIIITFYGSRFDTHFLLEALARYGEFGKRSADRVIIGGGNKLLGVDWKHYVRFTDMYRFTQGSLASTCSNLRVKTPKSKINLQKVQDLFDFANHNLNSFWVKLAHLKYADLVEGISEDSQDAIFVEKVKNLNGRECYIKYCENDAIATLECWLKLRNACNTFLDYSELDSDIKKELLPFYDINKYYTAPSMAFKLFMKGLPHEMKEDGKKGDLITPPLASSYAAHRLITKCFLGGRSEVYNFVPPGIITEPHAVLDASSLYPGAAMIGKMPAGEMKFVANRTILKTLPKMIPKDIRKDVEPTDILPVPNKLGGYYCIITDHPTGIHIIPYRDENGALDWNKPAPHFASVPVQILRMHLHYGGKAKVIHGFYFTKTYSHYYDNSVDVWRCVKMRQDELQHEAEVNKKKIKDDPDLSSDEKSKLLAEQDETYSPAVRFLAKFLSVSFLGAAAKRLILEKHSVLYGNQSLTEFSKENQKNDYCINHLASPPSGKTMVNQLLEPYNYASIATVPVDPNSLFDKSGGKTIKVPPACLTLTMFGYAACHMYPNLRKAYLANAVRGVETDGIHMNHKVYENWCVSQGYKNPYWIDGPLLRLKAGDPLDDDVFKDDGQILPMYLLGSMRCTERALIWKKNHPEDDSNITPMDYLYFKDEIGSDELFNVSYPFKKFYYYKPIDPTSEIKEQIRSKGVGRDTRDGEEMIKVQLRHLYRRLHKKSKLVITRRALSYHNAVVTDKPMKRVDGKTHGSVERNDDEKRDLEIEAKELSKVHASAPRILNAELFARLGSGYGVDAADYRFQGRLGKANSSVIHVGEARGNSGELTKETIAEGIIFDTPIHYSFLVKRLEPDKSYIARFIGGLIKNDYITLNPVEVEEVVLTVRSMFHPPHDDEAEWVERMYRQRGFTYECSRTGTNIYFSNESVRFILRNFKYNKEQQKYVYGNSANTDNNGSQREECSTGVGDTDLSTTDRIAGGNGAIQVGSKTLWMSPGKAGVLSKK